MIPQAAITDTVQDLIPALCSGREAAESQAAENARLRAELADQVARRVRAEGERDRFEEQLRQARKMDAPGRTLKGAAHDFNNILSVVLGFSELLQSHLAADPHGLGMVGEIVAAGDRGRQLTERLFRAGQPTHRVEDWTCDRR